MPTDFEKIDAIDTLQFKANPGMGIACVRDILFFLKRGLDKQAEVIAIHDNDKISSYPEIQKALRKILPEYNEEILKSEARFLPPCGNKDCSCSTGIHCTELDDGSAKYPYPYAFTFGSGDLCPNGYWEHPCSICARAQEIKDSVPVDSYWPWTETPASVGKLEALGWEIDNFSWRCPITEALGWEIDKTLSQHLVTEAEQAALAEVDGFSVGSGYYPRIQIKNGFFIVTFIPSYVLWQYELKSGDEVFWNDPDEHACSRLVKIKDIKFDRDEACIIEEENGSVLECFLKELS